MTAQAGSFTEARAALVAALRSDVSDQRVLAAIARVPREAFVLPEARELAYVDRPLPIGHGQTISQPRMVATMLQELALRGDERVLEVGSGSGYQTALLAELAAEVVGVELIPELAEHSAEVLRDLGYDNVTVELAGDELGSPSRAPYDAIVVAAAAPRIPVSLIDQLAPGGRLAIPVGPRRGPQELMLVQRLPEGITIWRRGACGFVPLIGKEAFLPDAKQPND
jgi:protein-L-isoaspartate(D-aspartate) O-methyltransferase